jgi:hypothetical protein
LQKIIQTRRQSDTTPNENNTQQQHKIHTQITLFGLLRKSRNSSATTTTNSAPAAVYCLLFPKKKPKPTKNTMEIYFSMQNLCINWNQSLSLSLSLSLS